MPSMSAFIELAAQAIDVAGVTVIVAGLVIATFHFLVSGRRAEHPYRQYRQDIGRGILLGLEFLVAADIIRTVAVEPTLRGVLVLGLIVLVRTFLSVALEVELEGRWPWERGSTPDSRRPLHEE